MLLFPNEIFYLLKQADNQRIEQTFRKLVVLHSILEYLLHGASAARCVYNASFGDGQDAIFTNGILEVLGNMGGKGGSRLVPIEPGGYAKAAIGVLRISLHHGKCGG